MKRISHLTFESLESKNLLAADVSLLDGELLIKGTEKADQVVVSATRNEVVVTQGETVARFAANKVVTLRFQGGLGDDQFTNKTALPSIAYGNQGNDILIGGSAADALFGGPGNDQLFGGDGNDSLHGDHGDDTLEGGRGNDELNGWYGNDILRGDDGDDELSGYLGNDSIWGGNGNDVLKGHEGDDQLFGDAGNDKLYGWKGADLLVGGSGDDYLSGWSGNDILVGEDGDDLLLGHSGRDLLIGGKGSDYLNGGSDADFVISGWTKFDQDYSTLARLLSAWDSAGTTNDRFEKMKSFINSSDMKSVDGKLDRLVDDRTGLDLFVTDHKDVFVDA
jgi:Ca2+-binding RTX toxin-like protein